jgi:hypothetical protein
MYSWFPRFTSRADKFAVLDQTEVAFRHDHACHTFTSSSTQLCNSCLTTLFNLATRYIRTGEYLSPNWQEDIKNTQWLDGLHAFSTVKNLYLSEDITPRLVHQSARACRGTENTGAPGTANSFYSWAPVIRPCPGSHSKLLSRDDSSLVAR